MSKIINKNDMIKYAEAYDLLEDNISRDIFVNRMFYNITKDKKYIRNIVKRYVKRKPALSMRNEYKYFQEKPIIIYGAGYWGKKVYRLLQLFGLNVTAFCDCNTSITDSDIADKIEIITPYEAAQRDNALIVIASDKYMVEMSEQLSKYGVPKERIFIMDKTWFIFNDEKQYFDLNIIDLKDNEVFVDCGAADGWDTVRFLNTCGEDSKVFIFEPFIDNVEDLYKKFLYERKVHISSKGVWSHNCKLAINDTRGGRFSVQLYEDDLGNIDVVSLDSELEKEAKISYIKMDIEGSELNAIKGSEKIIARTKPKLAVCIYHRPEDIYEIPLYIKSIVPEYKFYIRHYSNYNCETVLYAVI